MRPKKYCIPKVHTWILITGKITVTALHELCTFTGLMKDYKKYYLLSALPEEVYNALTNPVALKLWTGDEAVMSTEPNSEFSLWEGSIVGKNLEFEENKKIVQQWYFEGVTDESVVIIKLHPHEVGTSVELRHSNIPDDDYDNIVEGWNDMYFGNLKEFFSL